MVENTGKINKCLITIIVLITLAIIYIVFNINKVYKNNCNLKDDFSILENEYKSKKATEEAVSKEINYYINLDNSIIETKKNVFKLASNLEQKILKGNNKTKIAYLTFDDGPYYLTNKYLEVLKKYKVKATFFTIGAGKTKCYDNSAFDCTTMYEKIAHDNHTIANHTYSHQISKGIYTSANAFITQVKKQEELIKNKTGVITNIVRFPGGSPTAGRLKNSIIKELQNNNYGWVDWTALDGDGSGLLFSRDEAMTTLKKGINEDIEVVLLHDYDYITLSVLPDIIEYLESNNYILLPLFYESVKINK